MTYLAAILYLAAGWLISFVVGFAILWTASRLVVLPEVQPEPETAPPDPEPLRPIPEPIRCPGCGRLLNIPGDRDPVCGRSCTRLQIAC